MNFKKGTPIHNCIFIFDSIDDYVILNDDCTRLERDTVLMYNFTQKTSYSFRCENRYIQFILEFSIHRNAHH